MMFDKWLNQYCHEFSLFEGLHTLHANFLNKTRTKRLPKAMPKHTSCCDQVS